MKRMRKYRKKGRKLALVAQIVAILYLLILTGTYFITDTGAYFNDVETIENFLGRADEFPQEEWDRSSLEFTDYGGSFCSTKHPGLIFSEIANVGDRDMAGTTKFYLYRVDLNEQGPNKNNPGDLIASGDVPALPSSKKAILSFEPDLKTLQPGKYKLQRMQTSQNQTNQEHSSPKKPNLNHPNKIRFNQKQRQLN